MPIFVREPHDFIFDRRAIARAARLDLPGIHRRTMQIRADQLVDRVVGESDPARELRLIEVIREKRKRLRLIVAGLQFGPTVVDRAAVEPRRRAGFEAAQLEAELPSAPLMPAVVPSPARPPAVFVSPVCMMACRNVPVVRITARAR